MSEAIDDEDSVIRRVCQPDDVVEDCQISSVPPRHIVGSDVLFAAPDAYEVKINFVFLLDFIGLIDKDELVCDGECGQLRELRLCFLLEILINAFQ